MIRYGVIAHGGAGSPEAFSEGCRAACESAFTLLEAGQSALEAAAEGARVLEDDGRFNAGRGSALRLDGKTVEMDAAVMDSRGDIGAVISIRDVRNPVLVAKGIIDTPHLALSGQGATAFARRRGFPSLGSPSPWAEERYERLRELLRKGKAGEVNPRWRGYDVESLWNFDGGSYRDLLHGDTIGVVALDRSGILAVAVSTGGASPMLLGRVGDTPMIGCGFYAGPACAVATTGIGEEIIKRMLAREVYDMVEDGEDIQRACAEGVGMFLPEFPVGVAALSQRGYALECNTTMARGALVKED